MRQTTNYQLPSWDSDDRILRTDFNDLTEKTDAALADHAAGLADLTAALAAKGNCQIYTSSYVGTGTYGEDAPCSLTFPKKPLLVIVTEQNGSRMLHAVQGCQMAPCGTTSVWVCWTGNTMRWYDIYVQSQLNQNGNTYLVLALLAADQ